MRTWIIGRGDDCDIVLETNVASTHHCRLTSEDHQLILEDLGSTNGTYVNGKKITQRVVVRLEDRITLGRNVPMPCPKSILADATVDFAESPRTLTIGRGPENSLVIDAAGVSWQHARLCLSGTEAVLEDLDSTNGTFLNSRANEIDRAPLSPSDVVYFGSYRIAASRLLQIAKNL